MKPKPDSTPLPGSEPAPAPTAGPADRHIDTDHLLKNLRHRAVSGGIITAGAQAVRFGLSLGTAIALARLLSKDDFGLVALAGVLMSILRMFGEGGLSIATVQQDKITQVQISNLFWINLAYGCVSTLIGVAMAPVIAWFNHDSRLIVITAVLSLTFAISGSAVQHLALLNRQMRFKTTAIIDISAMTVSFLTGVIMAKMGFGYWSLVGMQLASSMTEATLTWLASGWRPQLPQADGGTKAMLHFGASLTVFNLLRRLAQGTDVLLLGRYYGAGTVGLYSRATALLSRPLDQFAAPFDAVFVPLLSRLQNQPQRYRQVFLQAFGVIALLSFPFAGLFLGLAKPLVPFLLGPGWEEVVPIFAWVTFSALYVPLSYAAVWLLTTQGRSADLWVTSVAFPLIVVLSVVAGMPFGATGVALSLSMVGLFIRLPVQFHIMGRSGPVSPRDLWGVFFRHLPLWGGVAATSWAVRMALSSSPLLVQLSVGGLAGGAVAFITVLSWPALRTEAMFLIARLREVVRKPKEKTA